MFSSCWKWEGVGAAAPGGRWWPLEWEIPGNNSQPLDGDDSSLNGKFRGPGEDLLPEAIPAGNFVFFGS